MQNLAEEIERMANSPSSISSTKAYGKSWILTCGGILNIYGNVNGEDYERKIVPNEVKQIQFARSFLVNTTTLNEINTVLLCNNPDIRLRETFNGCGAFKDLQFLKYLPDLKCFGFGAFKEIDLSPIKDYVELHDFGLGGYNISLKPIENYKHFKSFGFGDKIKDTKVISTFSNLENLGISGQNLKNLDFITPLKHLKRIAFSLGGTIVFDDLALLEQLEELDIWRSRKLEVEHLLPITEVKSLKILKLRELPRITDLSWLNNSSIETLVIEDLRGLSTFESLKNNQYLKKLVIKDSRLNVDKIISIGKLSSIDNIQVSKWYLDNKSDSFSVLPNFNKIKEIEFEYLF